MVTPTKKPTAEEQAELHAAAELVLEREEIRQQRLEKRRQRQARQREKEQLAAVRRMQTSIEVMKWCIVGIAAIMFLGIVIAIWTLSAVHREVVKVQTEVEEVRPVVERVISEVNDVVDGVEKLKVSLQNPMQSIGSAFGKELDAKLQSYMGTKLGGGE